MQTVVANVQAKTPNMSLHRERENKFAAVARVFHLLEMSVILFGYYCLLVLNALWFLSLTLIVGHLVFLLFSLVFGVRWFLSLVVHLLLHLCLLPFGNVA